MYKVNFSLDKWNFSVFFNKEEDKDVYKDIIYNSVIEKSHKTDAKGLITINYINDYNIYNNILKEITKGKKEVISSFKDEYYDKYQNTFVSKDNNYLIHKTNDNTFNLICKNYLKRPELIYVIREIYVRLKEDDKSLFLHGNGVEFENMGLIIAGNSGSGKTTFMFKLFEDNDNKSKYLSNDRIFLDQENTITYFPIPLILANGTAKNNKQLYEYLNSKDKLYDSNFSKEILNYGENTVKYPLFKKYIPKIYENCSVNEKINFNVMILPKIDYKYNDVEIIKEDNYKNLMKICFTPNDTESLRKPWILERKISDEDLTNISEQKLSEITNENLVYNVFYNPNLEPSYIRKRVKKEIINNL